MIIIFILTIIILTIIIIFITCAGLHLLTRDRHLCSVFSEE